MQLSKVLEAMGETGFRLEREREFDYLALSVSGISQPHCIFLDSEKFVGDIAESVTMILTTPALADKLADGRYGLCITERPRLLFFRLHNYLSGQEGYRRPAFPTVIGENCCIHPMTSIAEENVIIGNNVVIEEFVVIRANTVIGDNCIIRAGVKIGGQGFEFKRQDGGILSVEHAGGVVLGNYVEIQHNSCVDRAIYPWDNTVLRDHAKIDNLVHIGHADILDEAVMMAACSCLGGRTRVKRDSWIGMGAMATNGIVVGEGSRINMGAVASRAVPDFASVTGNFAIPHDRFIQNLKASLAEPEEKTE